MEQFTEKAEMMMLHHSALAIATWLKTPDGIALCPGATVEYEGEDIVVTDGERRCVIITTTGVL